jgi:formylglycine-generating enzyme required for sulfatase activity
MIVIPAGTYVIGNDNGPAPSRPSHTVTLGAFGLDRREVTVSDYEEFVRTGAATAPWSNRKPPGNVPVTGLTLHEATAYCAWRHPRGGRLPREEEWEAAARAGDGRLYPWGNVWDATLANTGSRQPGPVAVGSYPGGRSPLGMEDLIGNVWEWTSSRFQPYGSDPTSSAESLFVIRGGAYNSWDSISTAIFRGRAWRSAQRSDLAATGFRCAMSALKA